MTSGLLAWKTDVHTAFFSQPFGNFKSTIELRRGCFFLFSVNGSIDRSLQISAIPSKYCNRNLL